MNSAEREKVVAVVRSTLDFLGDNLNKDQEVLAVMLHLYDEVCAERDRALISAADAFGLLAASRREVRQ